MKFILLLFVCVLPVSATTYYVDVVAGNNANAGTSQGSPWKHLPGTIGQTGAGWASIVNGDIIYVKGDTTNLVQVFFDSTKYNGSRAYDSIQVRSGHLLGSPWGSSRAVFDEEQTRLYGIAMEANGLTVEGFEIRNIASGPNAIYGNGSACVQIGGIAIIPGFMKLKNCYLHHAYGTEDDVGHGIEGYGNSDPSISATNCIFERLTVSNVRTKAIELFGTGHIIRNCYFEKSGDHNMVLTAVHCDVYNCIFNMNGADVGVAETTPFVHDPVFSCKMNLFSNDVFNCIAFSSTQADHAQGFASHGPYNRFYSCTTYGFKQLGNFGDNGANGFNLGFERSTANNTTGNEVQNCIASHSIVQSASGQGQVFFFYACTNSLFRYNDIYATNGTDIATWYDGASTLQLTIELFNDSFPNGIVNANNISVNPLYTGGSFPSGLSVSFLPNTDFFKLLSSSPSLVKVTGNVLTTKVNNGAQDSSKFAFDILGNLRVIWSMGAYESALNAASVGGIKGLNLHP